MPNQAIIEQNVQKLQDSDINEITFSTTVQEIDGVIVCYANLLIEKTTGKILKLTPSHQVFWQEDAVSTPVAIKTKNLFEGPSLLELAQKQDLDPLPSQSKDVVQSSLESFNKLMQAYKSKSS